MAKKTENPPPKTSPKVEKLAATKLSTGTKAEKSLAGSVLRHVEPRNNPKGK